MSYLKGVRLKVKNYKCFGEDPQGFDEIYPLNIIIGKNNSGKSALLDLPKYAIQQSQINQMAEFNHKGKAPELLLSKELVDSEIRSVFADNASGGYIQINHHTYGSRWLNASITVKLNADNSKEFISIDPDFDIQQVKDNEAQRLGRNIINLFEGRTFKRIVADRDIAPEADGEPRLQSNGQGATNVIQSFISRADLNRSHVEVTLLKALNEIFSPDLKFTRILVQRYGDGRWEIYLEEENKGRIRLSDSGSGLKTILLVLVNLILIPILENRSLENYIFAFEELENNLHPGLQRKLLTYIRKVVAENNCYVFLTTHSNIIIDLFSKDSDAQILHATHNGEVGVINRVRTYLESSGVIDDLDVRASDLLQANGIVWVEGPSDRAYFNKWISLWTNGKLKEGLHYQFAFYGGSILAHITANPDGDPTETGLDILRVNRNAIILMDSDKKSKSGKLSKAKKKIIEEVKAVGGLTWVTSGNEIENYIPTKAFQDYYQNNAITALGKYAEISEYLERIKTREGKKFLRSKVVFAENIILFIKKEDLDTTLDLRKRLNAACNTIKSWNRITNV